MLRKLKEYGRLELSLFLAAMTIFCFALSIFRIYVTYSRVFLFLNWNLFLAFIPWLASSIIIISSKLRKQKSSLLGLLFIWILFFPNSPYILTDLFYLRVESTVPIWFDLILILSFAWTGLVYGFVSLVDIETLLVKNLGKQISGIIIVFLLFLGSFGVYLGRFLRWNSWDVIQDPFKLGHDIGDRLINPIAHSRTWGLTILMGILLNMMYWSIKLIRREYSSI
jgi:uncharacterized membrane protein